MRRMAWRFWPVSVAAMSRAGRYLPYGVAALARVGGRHEPCCLFLVLFLPPLFFFSILRVLRAA